MSDDVVETVVVDAVLTIEPVASDVITVGEDSVVVVDAPDGFGLIETRVTEAVVVEGQVVSDLVTITETSAVVVSETSTTFTVSELTAVGPPGLPGPAGEVGQDGKDAYQLWLDAGHVGTVSDFFASLAAVGFYRYVQGAPSDLWIIDHTLSFSPAVTVVDSAGNPVIGEITYVSASRLTIAFSAPFSGEAYLS